MHTQQQAGRVTRLTVAVLVDDITKVNPKTKKTKRTPLKPEEIAQVTKLVRDAIGFNPQRGDTVTVINRSFAEPEPIEAAPPVPMWKQPWVMDLAKQVTGGIFVLFVLFGVLRPTLRNLSSKSVEVMELALEGKGAGKKADNNNGSSIQIGEDGQPIIPTALLSYDQQMKLVKNMAKDDPKRVAQVVKRWIDKEK